MFHRGLKTNANDSLTNNSWPLTVQKVVVQLINQLSLLRVQWFVRIVVLLIFKTFKVMNIEKKLERKPNGNDIWYLFIVIMIVIAMYCFYILKGQ